MRAKRSGQGTARFAARRPISAAVFALGSLGVLACGAGCGERASGAKLELAPIVAPAIAELEHEIASQAPRPSAALDDATRDRLRELLRPVHGASFSPTIAAEMRAIGDGAVPMLASAIADASLSEAQRARALQLLGAIDSPLALAPVEHALAEAPDSALRRAAASSLGGAHDELVPFLLARLRSESDDAVIVEISRALLSFGNASAIARTAAIARSASPARDAAQAVIADALRTTSSTDPATLAQIWNAGDPERRWRTPEPSLRHRLEVWRAVRDLASADRERADEARFVLVHEAAWVALVLSEALRDVDEGTRTAAARCIGAMGVRAVSAGPALQNALRDPRLAPEAAAALGDIGYAQAWRELARRLDADDDLSTRIAAARALGRLNLDAGVEPLRATFASSAPLALRQACAQSLVVLGRGGEVAAWLAECMTSDDADVDADAAERSLEYWLEHDDATPSIRSLVERWRKLAGPPGIDLDAAALHARRAARAELVRAALHP